MLSNHYYTQLAKDTLACGFGGVSISDLVIKIINNDLNFNNANTFVQFLFTIVALLFAIQRFINYRIDSKTKSDMLRIDRKIKYEQSVKAERENFPHKWNKDFIENK